MSHHSEDIRISHAQEQKTQERNALVTGGVAHLIHDGFSDMLYILFPIWQMKLGLSFAEVGFLKTLFSGSMAFFQIPSGILANRLGEAKLLLTGALLTSLAVIFYGWGTTTVFLGILLVIGGIGSSVQHPLSSSLISAVYQDSVKRRVALSTYNVCGDLGKLIFPMTAAFLITRYQWPAACRILGLAGLLAAGVIYVTTRTISHDRVTPQDNSHFNSPSPQFFGWQGQQSFWALAGIGILDSATRMGFLTFFPFLLRDKGADVPTVGLALTLIFAGGAAGKFFCGVLSTRFGILRTVVTTEIITVLCICSAIFFSLGGTLLLGPLLGVALNGTSSVLYGSVPELVPENMRKQGFAIFYTATIGSGAAAPFLYGFIGDILGLPITVMIIAAALLLTIPLTIPLRRNLAH